MKAKKGDVKLVITVLIGGKAYGKEEIKDYLKTLQTDSDLYGGYGAMSSESSVRWGVFCIVTVLFLVGGVVWIRLTNKKTRE